MRLFQSTFPRGERQERTLEYCAEQIFQSTFPRGDRRLYLRILILLDDFNPRSRVGNDIADGQHGRSKRISIHVPAWGTTKRQERKDVTLSFQSTFPRGERRKDVLSTLVRLIFQSTFPRGERPESGDDWYTAQCLFQSTFPRGERQR